MTLTSSISDVAVLLVVTKSSVLISGVAAVLVVTKSSVVISGVAAVLVMAGLSDWKANVNMMMARDIENSSSPN